MKTAREWTELFARRRPVDHNTYAKVMEIIELAQREAVAEAQDATKKIVDTARAYIDKNQWSADTEEEFIALADAIDAFAATEAEVALIPEEHRSRMEHMDLTATEPKK